MNGQTVATIRGKNNREEFKAAIGTDEIPIRSPLTVRMYTIDPNIFTEAQLKWFIDRYGIALPADECTISMK